MVDEHFLGVLLMVHKSFLDVGVQGHEDHGGGRLVL